MILQLIRYRLSAMVAFSTWAGYALWPAPGDVVVAWAAISGVFFLASGCSALNQVQERDIDALMERTRGRPIASGRLSSGRGLLAAALFIACGLVLLGLTGRGSVVGLGIFTLLWYNGLYTPLKRKTAFAVLPGALCGAAAPLMGWGAAGGELADYRIVLVAGLFFIWQMPHFWLLLWRHREDYARAGLPNLFDAFPVRRAAPVLALWLFALVVASLLPLAFGLVSRPVPQAAYLAAVAGVLFLSLRGAWFCYRPAAGSGQLFLPLNLAMATFTACLLLEAL